MVIESMKNIPSSFSKHRVAHLMENYAATGENYVYEQVNFSQMSQGYLLAEWDLHFLFDPVRKENRAIFRSTFQHPYWERVLRYLTRHPFEKLYLRLLNRFFHHEISKRGAEIIHAHFGMMGYKALPIVQRLQLPLVVTFYGVDASQAVKDPYWRPRLARMLGIASKVMVLCDEAKDRLIALGCNPEKIEIWDIGIPIDEYVYRFPRVDVEDGATKFLIVARFVEKKGYPYLLKAFQRLIHDGLNVRLTIAGNGPLKETIEQTIINYGLQDYIQLIDTVGRPDFFDFFKKLLAEHDIFVLPSVIAKNGDDEGGPPVVIANAQAAGLPVISTPVGGITRAIRDQETGFLVEPESVESLYTVMSSLVKNTSKLAEISHNARAHVEKNFDVKKQLARVEQVYNEILSVH